MNDKVDLANKLSLRLVNQISEDVYKACNEAGLPPSLTTVILKIHDQQKEMEKSIQDFQKVLTQTATTMATLANVSMNVHQNMAELNRKHGYANAAEVGAEDLKDEH